MQQTTASVVYCKPTDIIVKFCSMQCSSIKILSLSAENANFAAQLKDDFIQSNALILVLSDGTLQNLNCIKALKLAIVQHKKIVLVHDVTTRFPSYTVIKKLDKEIQPIFSSIVVPLAKNHLEDVWNKIEDKIFDRIKVF